MIFCPVKINYARGLIKNTYLKYVDFLENYLSAILLLAIRIWIGLVFFKSGLTKFFNIDSAILLFEHEYSLPLISAEFAAISATIFELGCGAALIAGLLTRITTLPLIGMTLVIQLLVFQNQEHFYWLFLLSTLAIYGGGMLSIDGILAKCCKRKNGEVCSSKNSCT